MFRWRATALLLAAIASLAASAFARPSMRVEGNKVFGARRVVALAALPDPTPEWSRQEWVDWSVDAATLVREPMPLRSASAMTSPEPVSSKR
jgi:hypothetical protein